MSSLWKQHGPRPHRHNEVPSTPLQGISWGSSLPPTQPAALNQGICSFPGALPGFYSPGQTAGCQHGGEERGLAFGHPLPGLTQGIKRSSWRFETSLAEVVLRTEAPTLQRLQGLHTLKVCRLQGCANRVEFSIYRIITFLPLWGPRPRGWSSELCQQTCHASAGASRLTGSCIYFWWEKGRK